jgi:hypothetical protein
MIATWRVLPAVGSVQSGTAPLAAWGYARLMLSRNIKPIIFGVWVVAVILAAIVIGVTSVSSWILVAGVAIVPPVVVRQFWHTPEQTTSEAIHEARLTL